MTDGRSLPIENLFVGREHELRLVDVAMQGALQGDGRVVLLSGEAGIGKTRVLEEVAKRARGAGLLVLPGKCDENAAGHSYGAFRAALEVYVGEVGEHTLRMQLGAGAQSIAQLVPGIRKRLRDVAEPVRLQPDEERTRLLDAVGQFLIAIAVRTPVLLAVDDLHWADDDTLALFRHIGRQAMGQRIVLLGSYREHEFDEEGSLAQTVAVLRRQSGCERIALSGLATTEVATLLHGLAARRSTVWAAGPVEPALTKVISNDTKGNPFFVYSLVLHLEEEGQLRLEEGRWLTTMDLEAVALPDGVRQVLRRRISRLTQEAQSFLTGAAAIGARFRFDIAAAISELNEDQALAVIDEALKAQLVETASELDCYDFVHALVRETLYQALNPSRQVRLHRRVAEIMERVYGERAGEHAAEIAAHYHRSHSLPDAQRGVPFCLTAAESAIARVAYSEAAAQLRAALDLLPTDAPERLRIRSRLGLVLVGAAHFEEGAALTRQVAQRLAVDESAAAAASYLADIVRALFEVGGAAHIFPIALDGLRYTGNRRDETWATFKIFEIRAREISESNGIPMDTPERRELAEVLERASGPIRERFYYRRLTSRAEVIASDPEPGRFFPVGDYRGGIRSMRRRLSEPTYQGRIGISLMAWTDISRWHVALGEFDLAQEAKQQAIALANRSPEPSHHTAHLISAEDEWRLARDEHWDEPMQTLGPGMSGEEELSYRVTITAATARTLAHLGQADKAIRRLSSILAAIEQAPGWMENYARIVCDAAATLWLCQRVDGIEIIERNLLAKVIEPDFHHPMMDGRLALARVCALQGRFEEAQQWFAKARTALDRQGARPLRAITDFDEAWMYIRRAAPGDASRAGPLLDAALEQFQEIGMPGWIRRADTLRQRFTAQPDSAPRTTAPAASTVQPVRAVFRAEGEIWAIAYDGTKVLMKPSRGLALIAQLLGQPGREIAASELVGRIFPAAGLRASIEIGAQTSGGLTAGGTDDAGELLDAPARTAYKRRLVELREELAEAEQNNDIGRCERLRTEIEFLTVELARAVGLGGRARRAGSHAERARINVTRTIAAALAKIAACHPALGAHLSRTIHTGTFCSYAPDPRAPIDWDL